MKGKIMDIIINTLMILFVIFMALLFFVSVVMGTDEAIPLLDKIIDFLNSHKYVAKFLTLLFYAGFICLALKIMDFLSWIYFGLLDFFVTWRDML